MNRMDKRVSVLSGIYEGVLDLAFPRHCPICDRVLGKQEYICPECADIPRLVREPRCIKCGKHVSGSDMVLCYDCRRMERHFDEGLSLYEYVSVKDSIYTFKNQQRPEYADFYGMEMTRVLGERIRAWNADAIIPVPLHPAKERKRGYNQAGLLSKEISRHLHIPVRDDLLVRRRKTPPQKKMSLEERQNNLKKAFHMKQNDVKLKSIIMVDDVFTTGNTMDAVSRILKEAGVKRVYTLTLAIGSGLNGERKGEGGDRNGSKEL